MINRLRKSNRLFLALALLVALALRLDFLNASDFVIDADEGIVGLMAKHIGEGQEIPVFYYGQSYMGSLEPLLVSGVFAICGVSVAALKVVPLIFSLILVLLVFELARLVAGPVAARVAALYIAVPPVALIEWSTKARGGFIELIVIGTLALICTVRWLRDPRLPLGLTVATGLLLGLGWWVNNQIIFFLLPIGLYFLVTLLRRGVVPLVLHFVVGVVAFLVGGLPFWIYNLEHAFASFGMFHTAKIEDLADQLAGLFTVSLPMLIGGRRFWQNVEIFPGATIVGWLALGGILLYVVWSRRGEFAQLLRGRVDHQQPVLLLLIFLLTTCLVFGLSSFGFLYEAPRYLLPLYTAIAVLVGYVVAQIRFAALRSLVVAALLSFNLASYLWGGRAIPGEPFVFEGQRVAHDHRPLIEFLDRQQIDWVQTNYWIGYRLAFETGERIRFLVFGRPTQTRIEEYRRKGVELGREPLPLVLVPAQALEIERSLGVLGLHFKRADIGGYVVLYDLHPSQENLEPIRIDSSAITANYNSAAAAAAVDQSLATRWGSAHPQVPGMALKVSFSTPQHIRGLAYELGEWHYDYPRGLSIALELADGGSYELLPASAYDSVRTYVETASRINFYFEPQQVSAVVLRQEGSHPILDWSIAELRLFS